MIRVGFEPTIPVFERAKTVHALDRAVTVIGSEVCFSEIIVGNTLLLPEYFFAVQSALQTVISRCLIVVSAFPRYNFQWF
jgi:hypothetical protein